MKQNFILGVGHIFVWVLLWAFFFRMKYFSHPLFFFRTIFHPLKFYILWNPFSRYHIKPEEWLLEKPIFHGLFYFSKIFPPFFLKFTPIFQFFTDVFDLFSYLFDSCTKSFRVIFPSIKPFIIRISMYFTPVVHTPLKICSKR